MTPALRVLVVEDSESDAELTLRALRRAGYELEAVRVETAEAMGSQLAGAQWDVVLADYRLPQFDAPSALAVLQESGLDLPFIVVSGMVGEDLAVSMMRAGAHDYLMKDNLARLAPAVDRELREAHTRRERRRVEQANADLLDLLSASNELAIELGGVDEVAALNAVMAERLRSMTGAVAVAVSSYDPERSELVVEHLALSHETEGGREKLAAILGRDPVGLRVPVDDAARQEMLRVGVGCYGTLHDVTFGALPTQASAVVADILGSGELYALALASDERLLGTCLVVMRHAARPIPVQVRFALARICSAALRRTIAESALRASEARFGAVFRNSPQAVALARIKDGALLDVNAAWCRVTGFGRDEAVGRSTADLGLWLDSRDRDRLVTDLREHGTLQNVEFLLRSRAGAVKNLLLSADTIDVAGEACLLTMAVDISDRKLAEESLKVQEERLRLAVEGAALGTWHWSLADGSLLWSDRMYAMFGRSPGTPMGRGQYLDAIHPDDRAAVEQALRSLPPASAFEIEHRVVWPDGSEHTVALTGRGYPGRDGEPARMEGVARDITDQKRLEMQLRQAQKMEAIGRLAGGVAHDFNNILGVIQGRCDLILNTLGTDDPLRKHLMLVQQSGDRAAALTRQLLAFSRQQPVQPEVLDLNEAVRGLEGMLRRLLGEEIEMVTRLAEPLQRVKVDRSQLEQVILNLAVNGRDAMPDGGQLRLETADVELDAAYAREHEGAVPGAYVRLAVTDTGRGMDKRTADRIFEPFFTTKEVGKGTGLGLATVYGIVKQACGHIWVTSEVGRGTTFEVFLPRTDEPLTEHAAAGSARTRDGDGEQILVVEDDPGMRDVVQDVLAGLGYRVVVAANGADALRVVEDEGLQPDLVITDCVMPGMSGEVLAQRLRRTMPALRVLFMSGYTDRGAFRNGFLGPGSAFMQKPFRAADLAARVRDALASARSPR